ncbi:glucokinase [Aliikangiella coralliicola]|uniref:Glucokinase n=1 Tax=Aliikangiella coralliicola TaxID=2592383 RepID=A0A545UJQ2_9GAMM|nr:glucokinase [Aliikangiella coralliicola]TQV89686.1 glucokinase [Aliikangiella coralliicola]
MQQLNNHCPYIVADIGGTNARFGLVTTFNKENQQFTVENQQTYPSAEFDGVEQAVACYRETLDEKSIEGACLAVAGPVAGERIRLTNLNWDICVPSTRRKLGFSNLQIINDFAAYAYAIQYLEQGHLRTINQGNGIKGSPIAVLGPGTGFGVAALVTQNHRVNVLASEGGHMSLAANTALQAAIKEQLSRKYSLVSVERVFSGPGLRHLYHALAAVEGRTARQLSTAEISRHALAGTDEMCQRTLALFCSWLGGVTGDLALALGARGGVFLGGGILPRIADFLIDSDFKRAFRAKDQMSHYLEDIPVQLVTEGNSALLGAAAWFRNSFEH